MDHKQTTQAPAREADLPKPEADEEQVAVSEEEARRIAEQYESESPTRQLSGPWRWVVGILAAGLAIYGLYWTQVNITTQVYRASFLMLALALTFLLYPIRGRGAWIEFTLFLVVSLAMVVLYFVALPPFLQGKFQEQVTSLGALLLVLGIVAVVAVYRLITRGRSIVPAYDLALVLLAVASPVFLILNYEQALQRIVLPNPSEVLMGVVLIALVLEATRRTTGWVLSAVAVGFLFYAWLGPYMPEPIDHRGYSVQRIVGQNFLTLEGIFGVPIDVAATFIVLFTVYGAVLEYSGAGKFFLDWAFAALGRSHSGAGPGRTVTAAGFLLGTVSGSGVATTVTLGSLAWPMLRRAGDGWRRAGRGRDRRPVVAPDARRGRLPDRRVPGHLVPPGADHGHDSDGALLPVVPADDRGRLPPHAHP
jgi:TRAP-type uncharacterized transport system fused permease subunit